MAGKRRTNGEGTIYQLPNGRWRVQITVQRGGKSVRISRKVKTRADARSVLDKLRNDHAGGLNLDGGQMLLSAWLKEWLRDTVKPNRAANTYESYRHSTEAYISGVSVCGSDKKRDLDLGKMPLSKLTPQAVKRWLAELLEHNVGGRTRENAYVVLKRALQVAVESNLIPRNPCVAVDRPAHEPKDANPFELAEALALLEAAKGHKHEALYRLALENGLRQGELFGLLWENVDLKEKRIHIRQQATEVAGKLLVDKPKTKKSIRTLSLTDTAVAALVKHKAAQLKAGTVANPIVFPNEDGGYFRKGTFNRWSWAPLLKAAGLKKRGFHQLRHTYATLMIMRREPINVVSELLGHSSVNVTMSVYAHVLSSMRETATETVAKMFG